MKIEKHWRVLTIGDGDLSFSASIASHLAPNTLVATAFDDKVALVNKYSNKFITDLIDLNVPVITGFDVTKSNTWDDLPLNCFDLVIFQFPLVPNNVTYLQHQDNQSIGSSNTINRWLLHQYLANCFEHFLAKDGQRLAMITSKDVKPYRQWNIETSIVKGLACDYIGQCDFNFNDYPNYQIRNVDRDKFVKETRAISYFYSDINQLSFSEKLIIPDYCNDPEYCPLCRVGPIKSHNDWSAHNQSKRHVQMSHFEQQWLFQLNNQ